MLSIERARNLVDKVVKTNDAEHASELLELFYGIMDRQNIVAVETVKYVYTLTPEFEKSFEREVAKFAA